MRISIFFVVANILEKEVGSSLFFCEIYLSSGALPIIIRLLFDINKPVAYYSALGMRYAAKNDNLSKRENVMLHQATLTKRIFFFFHFTTLFHVNIRSVK